jgi:predicted RNase H-like HicB family nuclease
MAWTQFVVMVREEGGGTVISAADLPGCHVRAPTRGEALTGIEQQIVAHVHELYARGESLPPTTPLLEHQRNAERADARMQIVDIWI